jgi:nitrite reductase (NADH) small subunit
MKNVLNNEHCLGPALSIPIGEGREFTVDGIVIAVFRSRNGSVYATQALCPHRAGPLADGLIGGSTLVCPLHAWKFDLETGQPVMGTCEIETYPVRVCEMGNIWVVV